MSGTKAQRTLSLPDPVLRILNENGSVKENTKPAVEVAKELQKLMLRMKGEAMSTDGTEVNYEKIKKSKLFKDYKQIAAGLRDLDLTSLNEKERMAFFINIYNALTIHGLVECESLPDSVLNVKLFWKTTAYKMGGQVFSLDDIEHGVLRGNRPHPASSQNPFENTDPRLKLSMSTLDPRIHFALVCGARSCPAINVYSAENLDSALTAAARSFCEQSILPNEITREIGASKIFQWYKGDFGKTDIDAFRWTMTYLSAAKKEELGHVLHLLEYQGMVDIKYMDYNWSLNYMGAKKDEGPPLQPKPQPPDAHLPAQANPSHSKPAHSKPITS